MTADSHTPVASDVFEAVKAVCRSAKVAQRALSTLRREQKDALLRDMAAALVAAADEIVAENAKDLENAVAAGMTPGLQDRLRLTPERVAVIAQQLLDTAALPDPVGTIRRGSTLPNGLELREMQVPLGVIGMVYEARPNVTVDAAGLCLKSGNAVVLRGGSAARHSNEAIVRVLSGVLAQHDLPAGAIASIDAFGREGVVALMKMRGIVDVLIPRGGASLIQTVVRESLVPAIETGTGNVHIFVDASADLAAAAEIVVNAKTQKVGACNAVETVLVHREIADALLPGLGARLREAGVTLHADADAASALGTVPSEPATVADWDTEYLSLDLAVKVVDSLDAAIAHIREFSTEHTEVIVTNDAANAKRFVAEIDAAAVMVNASPRFTDGGEFGFGAEIGISTQKLHARGPMGLPELTTQKWVVTGEGHVRP
ncbi:glutamate-5-semialdehyde dehydrogenase [Micrococcales bacterium 31B]|nr:glutamate-5-semialdehyde dehydrogenase [Micrococcales bacterium 31B]